jgi:hypothetical protein
MLNAAASVLHNVRIVAVIVVTIVAQGLKLILFLRTLPTQHMS